MASAFWRLTLISTGLSAAVVMAADAQPTKQQWRTYQIKLATAEQCTYAKADQFLDSDVRSDVVADLAYDGCKREFIQSQVFFLQMNDLTMPNDRLDAIFESSRGVHRTNLTRYVIEKRKEMMARTRKGREQSL